MSGGSVEESALFFVDGNNVMGSRPDGWWRDRVGAARRLLDEVAELARADGGDWTVVFDGPPPKPDAPFPPSDGVKVEYPESQGRDGADDHIVGLLGLLPPGSNALLYTSDRGLRERAEATGARVEGARALLSRLRDSQPWLEDSQRRRGGPSEVTTLTTQPKLTVRPTTPDDVPQILAFIRGIAEFEHLTHLVEATEESLRATLFGDARSAEALLGFVDGAPAGYAVYFGTYSTFLSKPGLYLEDIYVSPEHRRRGLGTLLLRRVAAIAVERGCGRFEWAALDWNVDAHRFYEGLGASMLSEWRLFRTTGEALRKLAEGEG